MKKLFVWLASVSICAAQAATIGPFATEDWVEEKIVAATNNIVTADITNGLASVEWVNSITDDLVSEEELNNLELDWSSVTNKPHFIDGTDVTNMLPSWVVVPIPPVMVEVDPAFTNWLATTNAVIGRVAATNEHYIYVGPDQFKIEDFSGGGLVTETDPVFKSWADDNTNSLLKTEVDPAFTNWLATTNSATVQYVDDHRWDWGTQVTNAPGFVKKSGDIMTGDLTMYEPQNGATIYFPGSAKGKLSFGSTLFEVNDDTGHVTIRGNEVATEEDLAGFATVADATLTYVSTNWVFADGLLEAARENISTVETPNKLAVTELGGNYTASLVPSDGEGNKEDFCAVEISQDGLVATMLGGTDWATAIVPVGDAVATKSTISGYQLGSQTNKLLQPAGNYADKTYVDAHQWDWVTQITNAPAFVTDSSLARVAFTGYYSDLSDTPYVPSVSRDSDGRVYIEGGYDTYYIPESTTYEDGDMSYWCLTLDNNYFYYPLVQGKVIEQVPILTFGKGASEVSVPVVKGSYDPLENDPTDFYLTIPAYDPGMPGSATSHVFHVDLGAYVSTNHAGNIRLNPPGSLAVGSYNPDAVYADGSSSLALGVYAKTTGYGSIAAGVSAIASNQFSFVHSGSTTNYSTYAYGSHGNGTFNVNPTGGIKGFWIGETNLATFVSIDRTIDTNSLGVTTVSDEQFAKAAALLPFDLHAIYLVNGHRSSTYMNYPLYSVCLNGTYSGSSWASAALFPDRTIRMYAGMPDFIAAFGQTKQDSPSELVTPVIVGFAPSYYEHNGARLAPYDEIQDIAKAAAKEVSLSLDAIAPVFVTGNAYTNGDFVIYDTHLYECTNMTSATWTPTDWKQTSVTEILGNLRKILDEINGEAL